MARSLLLLRSLSSSSRRFTTKTVPGGRRILDVSPPPPADAEFRSSSTADSDYKIFLRVLMPGVAREDVDVRVERNNLVICGLRRKQPYEEADIEHRCDFDVHRGSLNLADTKAVMKNGILKLVIPKADCDGVGFLFHRVSEKGEGRGGMFQ